MGNHKGTYLIGLSWEVNELRYVKHLAQWLTVIIVTTKFLLWSKIYYFFLIFSRRGFPRPPPPLFFSCPDCLSCYHFFWRRRLLPLANKSYSLALPGMVSLVLAEPPGQSGWGSQECYLWVYCPPAGKKHGLHCPGPRDEVLSIWQPLKFCALLIWE